MKRFLFFLTLFSLTSLCSNAQTAEDSVKATINRLFTAMKTSDSALLKTCFAEKCILQTISRNKEGKLTIPDESVDDFAKSISTQPKDALDEQIVFDVVKVDGPLAIAWTPYNFYYQGKFSHCGVNSFQLVRINGDWKIQYLIDTRRKSGCK